MKPRQIATYLAALAAMTSTLCLGIPSALAEAPKQPAKVSVTPKKKPVLAPKAPKRAAKALPAARAPEPRFSPSASAVASTIALNFIFDSKYYVPNTTTGVGADVLANRLSPRGLPEPYNAGHADAGQLASRSPIRLPEMRVLVLPSVSFATSGTIESIGATARGVF